jgi:uncharacterized protein (TIGR03083 family)
VDLARRAELVRVDSDALADAAGRDLGAAIPSCPAFDMADLVRHVLQVHRSWGRIVAEGVMEPDWSDAPFPPDDDLVDEFRANARWFADVLGATDPAKPCWTWGEQQNAGFVQRFQVQEAALHRWDAEHAVGTAGPIAPDGAADSLAMVNELLPAYAKDARVAFDVTATDVPLQITMRSQPDLPVAGALRGPAGDLLLVVWERIPVDAVEVTGDADAITSAIAAIDID